MEFCYKFSFVTIGVLSQFPHINHVLLKHTEQKCTVCSKEFKISLEVLSHIANEHHELEEPCSIQVQSTPKSGKEGKSEFVLSESILDEYL